MEKNTFIVRCGEIALKGMNKPYFERMLLERIKKNLKKYSGVEAKRQEEVDAAKAALETAKKALITKPVDETPDDKPDDKPEDKPNGETPDTEKPDDTTEESGCSSSLSAAAITLIATAGVTVVITSKKRKEN